MYVHVPAQLREGATPHTHTEGGARPVSGSGAHVTAVGSRGSPRATARRAAEVGDDDDSTRGSRRVVGCVFGCRRRDGGLGGQAAGARRLENRRHIHNLVAGTCAPCSRAACWLLPWMGGQPVRISSMVLLVAYAFYYRNVFSVVIYHHMPRERRCLRHPGPQQ